MITATAVMKYYPESNETQKGHMCQNKQGLESTKTKNNVQEPQVVHSPQPRVREVRVNVEDIKHIMYTVQMEQFPVEADT